jgi:hypothetical protein
MQVVRALPNRQLTATALRGTLEAVWGDRMGPFDRVHNTVKDGSLLTRHLDCATGEACLRHTDSGDGGASNQVSRRLSHQPVYPKSLPALRSRNRTDGLAITPCRIHASLSPERPKGRQSCGASSDAEKL